MKGLILFLLLALGSGFYVRAQGTVGFINFSYSQVYLSPDELVPIGNAFLAELMFAPQETALAEFENVAMRIGAPTSFNAPVPGRFLGGNRTVPVTPAGAPALFQVRVWESAYGSSYNQVLASGNPNARLGKSNIFLNDTGDYTTIPPGTPTRLDGLNSFTLGTVVDITGVPEPSAIVLLLVGGAAFCLRGFLRNRAGTLLLLLACGALTAANARAQGSVSFANNNVSRVYVWSGGSSTFAPVGSQYSVELMFAPDGTPIEIFDQIAVRLGSAIGFAPVPGVFIGGNRTAAAITPAGGFGLFQVRGWETAGGSSYMDSIIRGNYNVGKSAILRVDTADFTTTPPQAPATLTGAGLTSFCVGCIPEPSIVLLTLFGLTALVFGKRTFKK